ncbi:MAG TPA: hypothetical protein VEP89_18620, partial [Draconibacterium sp.]|nr:hypothetical protein [Draconibacterium sp.]
MSELGYISNRYKKISRLTNSVNSASIAVKKHSMSNDANYKKKFPKLKVSEDEYIKARIELINFI